MRILQIDDKAKEAILKLKTYAENNKVNLDTITKMHSGEIEPVGNNPNYSCYLHEGFRVVFSIEEQPSGSYRHISVSIDDPEKLPSSPALEMIIKEFDFTYCDRIWIEENVPILTNDLTAKSGKAINAIQKII